MRGRFKVPMLVVAAALLGLIALLATLQYKWLGRISDAERDGMKASLNTRASGFAQDFDSELTRAYLLFQVEPMEDAGNLAARVAARYDRWQGTARHPRLIKDIYLVGADAGQPLQRFNQATRFLEPAEWPDSMSELRAQLQIGGPSRVAEGSFFVRTIAPPAWEAVPALVVPMPVSIFYARGAPPSRASAAALEDPSLDFARDGPERAPRVERSLSSRRPQALWNQPDGNAEFRSPPRLSYTLLLLDREYVISEMLPALAQQHFTRTSNEFDYQLAVVSTGGRGVIYHSAAGFSPKPDAAADAAVDLFQVRTQDFGAVAAEVRRFAMTFTTSVPRSGPRGSSPGVFTERVIIPPMPAEGRATEGSTAREPRDVAIIAGDALKGRAAAAPGRGTTSGAPRWRLVVKHPSGSLETAVNAVRRRNLLISSSILGVLGASVGLLILSTRRAQELARQQMEFVAAVSHELRTPLAVIRSAGDNLAAGVIRDDGQIRKYGDLVRNEGRRLTEMVEQILEFAGIQSGQRGFALRPVAVAPMLHEIVDSSRALIEEAGMHVEYDLPENLPPVLGDEPALRRVFQNLIANAIKYGAGGETVPSGRRYGRVEGRIALRARQVGRDIHATVADRGIGIAPAEHSRIFEPFYRTADVVAAQTQGAGLGLSLVRRIVEAHGGRVLLRSAPGEGSEFTVVLPAAAEEPLDSPVLPLARDRPVAQSVVPEPVDSPAPPLARDRRQGHGSHA